MWGGGWSVGLLKNDGRCRWPYPQVGLVCRSPAGSSSLGPLSSVGCRPSLLTGNKRQLAVTLPNTTSPPAYAQEYFSFYSHNWAELSLCRSSVLHCSTLGGFLCRAGKPVVMQYKKNTANHKTINIRNQIKPLLPCDNSRTVHTSLKMDVTE